MTSSTIAVIPPTRQPFQRISASALGIRLCERCRPMVCAACKTLSQTHAEPEWVGGRGMKIFDRCHETDSCIERGGIRA